MSDDTPIKSTTQEYLEVEDVTNNIILLKDGSASLVLQVGAVNFALLSEEEQDALIYAYAALLNSLSFPIQILIRSERKDISDYLSVIQAQEEKQVSPVYKKRLTQYRQFVEQLVKERNVLDKKFHAIIPFTRLELGLSSNDINPLAKRPQTLPYEKDYIIQKALNTLEPRRDHLLRQFSRLGLSTRQLNTQELIHLLYTIHNPDAAEGIQTASSSQYQQSLVQSHHPINLAQTTPNQADEASPAPQQTTSSPSQPQTSNPPPVNTETTPPPTQSAPNPNQTPPTNPQVQQEG